MFNGNHRVEIEHQVITFLQCIHFLIDHPSAAECGQGRPVRAVKQPLNLFVDRCRDKQTTSATDKQKQRPSVRKGFCGSIVLQGYLIFTSINQILYIKYIGTQSSIAQRGVDLRRCRRRVGRRLALASLLLSLLQWGRGSLLFGRSIVIVEETILCLDPGASPLPQLACHTSQALRHLIAHFEIEQLQITSLVLELDLIAILEHLANAAAAPV